ncbi:FkbM family methyltransferase [Pedobacter cryoconitis]|uniref:FkbM family methyltransferase n=1 Tax=Pedobacter cryoconitis TaxID=188932 RepID=A0A7W9DZI7_9SPHI|nr:FkbM family methyltransferase [Pedobacter cryoconitis]MBB5637387.1 FkbM family methyltransferase [Pedobacter cryoconitis]
MAIQFIKRMLGIHHQSNVKPLKNLSYFGSERHGYMVPDNFLASNSICYCVGAGEDISFDTELKIAFDSRVYIFDPSPYGINHFNEVKDYVNHGTPLTLDKTLAPYVYHISSKQFSEIKFVPVGLWDEKKTLKFYDPEKENYSSHSAILFTDSKKFIEAPVNRLSNLMKELDHQHIDLLKIEIEGAEYKVIDTIIEDKLNVKAILVEFDEVYNTTDKSFHFRIKKSCDRLRKAGYVLAHSTVALKRLFIRKDVYDQLKKIEINA